MAQKPNSHTTHYPSDVTDQEWDFRTPSCIGVPREMPFAKSH
jgi:hypothetical protein